MMGSGKSTVAVLSRTGCGGLSKTATFWSRGDRRSVPRSSPPEARRISGRGAGSLVRGARVNVLRHRRRRWSCCRPGVATTPGFGRRCRLARRVAEGLAAGWARRWTAPHRVGSGRQPARLDARRRACTASWRTLSCSGSGTRRDRRDVVRAARADSTRRQRCVVVSGSVPGPTRAYQSRYSSGRACDARLQVLVGPGYGPRSRPGSKGARRATVVTQHQ